jgi:hypothetical protein
MHGRIQGMSMQDMMYSASIKIGFGCLNLFKGNLIVIHNMKMEKHFIC